MWSQVKSDPFFKGFLFPYLRMSDWGWIFCVVINLELFILIVVTFELEDLCMIIEDHSYSQNTSDDVVSILQQQSAH